MSANKGKSGRGASTRPTVEKPAGKERRQGAPQPKPRTAQGDTTEPKPTAIARPVAAAAKKPVAARSTVKPPVSAKGVAVAAKKTGSASAASAVSKAAPESKVAPEKSKPVVAEPPKTTATAAPPKVAPRPLPPLCDVGDVVAIATADHLDPFGFLGMHELVPGGPLVVRAFLPHAVRAWVVESATKRPVAELARFDEAGLFAGVIEGRKRPFPYRLAVETDAGAAEIEDPYRFPPVLSDADVHRLAEGVLATGYEKLGAHLMKLDGVDGVAFAVWAPHARRVAVIGEFNEWDGRRHGMRLRHDCGVWEIFLPGVEPGQLYKYEIKSSEGYLLADKSDPYAFLAEKSPGTASVVFDLDAYTWGDRKWMAARKSLDVREAPVSIYEVHPGSWRRKPEEDNRRLTYRELADELVEYVSYMGFTHIELTPICESTSEGGWGCQPIAPYAPTNRMGTPDDFRALVDRCHQAGIGVIIDWVPTHFSEEAQGLGWFDGSHLYESADPNQRRHPVWNSLTYDYGRREVASYLLGNALFWLDKYHVDGLRLDDLATMLYLDYGRARGQWTPNRNGGPENLEAVDFLRRLNELVDGRQSGAFTVAEDSSDWSGVSRPALDEGLGFGFKWNEAWTRDILRHMARNPIHRKYYHHELTDGPTHAFRENFVLPLSQKEVGHGKGSLIQRMPGDNWQKFANLRLFYALMYTHPGKKLMFMGDEFAQEREWNAEISLDWHLANEPTHQGIQRLVRDLNILYRSTPALYERDCEAEGFAWIDANDTEQSVMSFLRHGRDRSDLIAVVFNLTPVIRGDYRIGVPEPGLYEERLNTDAESYGGGNVGNLGGVVAVAEPMHGRPYSVTLKLPPFSAVVLGWAGDDGAA
jgi:1,4-alpha-glucan branching enzyme